MTVSSRYAGERPFDRLCVRNIGCDRVPGDPDFVSDLKGCCLSRVENHDLRACRSECKRDRPTNATAATGYDGNLVLKQKIRKVEHVFSPLLVSKLCRAAISGKSPLSPNKCLEPSSNATSQKS